MNTLTPDEETMKAQQVERSRLLLVKLERQKNTRLVAECLRNTNQPIPCTQKHKCP